jgi:hypothetical protein
MTSQDFVEARQALLLRYFKSAKLEITPADGGRQCQSAATDDIKASQLLGQFHRMVQW